MTDDEFIKLARDRFEMAEEADGEQRKRELDDLRFYAGDQWSELAKLARSAQNQGIDGLPPTPERPTLTINKVREPVRQVLNQEEGAEFNLELAPADDFGDLADPNNDRDREIELREGLLRTIQRSPEAMDARLWAASRAAIAGRGYYGVMTRYLPGKTSDQEIYVHRYYNQASVSLDPSHEQPDGSDADWGFGGGTMMSLDEYEKEFGENRVTRAGDSDAEWRALGDEAPGWFSDGKDGVKTARVMNYWYTEFETRQLCTMPDGTLEWEDELPDEAPKPIDKRRVVERKVKWAKIDGIIKLDETDWESPYIPIVKVLGEELHPYDDERRAEGMVRPARDSNQGFNAMVSKLVETIGLTPIPPWMVAEGTWETYRAWYQASTTRTLPALPYKTTDLMGQPAPPPFRTPVDTPIGDLAMSVQMFDAAIKSTTGVPDSNIGKQDPSVKSGKMAQILIAQSQHGTSHYLNNLRRSMLYEGKIENSLLYAIYGKRPGRLARILNGEGEPETVQIGQSQQPPPSMPGMPGMPPPMQGPPKQPYQLTEDANFNIVVKVVRAFDSRRTEESAMIGDLISANPQLITWFGDQWLENTDGPGHKEMAERAKVMLAPPIQQMLASKSKGEQPIPPPVQAQLQQMQQQLKDAHALLQKFAGEQQGKQAEIDGRLKEKQMDIDSRERIAAADRETKITVAELGAKVDRLALFFEERARVGVQGHDAAHAAMDRSHEVAMAGMQHQQGMEAGAVGAQQDAAASDQSHQQSMQAQEAAAQQQPPPSA